MTNNPKIVFVTSILTAKIFWAQVIALAATIATISGLHPAWATEANQTALVGMIDMFATMALRLWGYSGPVTLTGPLSAQPPQDLPVGMTHVIKIPEKPVPAPVASLTTVSSIPAPIVPGAAFKPVDRPTVL